MERKAKKKERKKKSCIIGDNDNVYRFMIVIYGTCLQKELGTSTL
jgi:hypothetical protein